MEMKSVVMNMINKLLKRGCLAAIACLSQGCATIDLIASNDRHAFDVHSFAKTEEQVWLHTIQANDRLSDIALEYTGNADNWMAIAEYNQLPASETLPLGKVIAIPGSLVTNELKNQRLDDELYKAGILAAVQSQMTNRQAYNEKADINVAMMPTLSVKTSAGASSQKAAVTVQAVSRNTTFKLTPLAASKNKVKKQNIKTPPVKVKVIGTYFPKGIYSQPANYSDLIMRATPGTLFELEQVHNDWFKIRTSEGIGYLILSVLQSTREA